jgi:hypothetical protein
VVDIQINFVTDQQVRIGTRAVGKAFEGERHGASGGVFEGHDAVAGLLGLDAVKDLWGK